MSRITVFIDEAGDPGVRDGLHYAATRHEWLCISAVVIRSSRADEPLEWIRECRVQANSTQAGALHFARISRERRPAVCASLASRPCRAFTVASHKTNLREYVNPRLQRMIEGGTFYNWCLRLLLERVTAWVEAWSSAQGVELLPMDVVFATRGHDWQHFFAYVDKLEMQSRTGTLYLKGQGLNQTLLDRTHWRLEKAANLAGLQCADIVASAFYQAANTASPSHDTEPARALRRIVAERHGSAKNVGVTVFPLPHQAPVPHESAEIFNFYGYGL